MIIQSKKDAASLGTWPSLRNMWQPFNFLKNEGWPLRTCQNKWCLCFLSYTAALQNGESGQKVATGVSNASTAMNHLLLGKKPLVATKPRRAPHPGAIPSPKNKRAASKNTNGGDTNNSHLRNTSATHYACPQVRLQFVPLLDALLLYIFWY